MRIKTLHLFNKIKSKVLFEDNNVPTAKCWWADTWTDDADPSTSVKSWAEETAGAVFNEAKLLLPLVVKPACQGSSIGLFFVERKEDLAAAVFEAFRVACDGDLKNLDKASKRSAVLIEEKIVKKHDEKKSSCSILFDLVAGQILFYLLPFTFCLPNSPIRRIE